MQCFDPNIELFPPLEVKRLMEPIITITILLKTGQAQKRPSKTRKTKKEPKKGRFLSFNRKFINMLINNSSCVY